MVVPRTAKSPEREADVVDLCLQPILRGAYVTLPTLKHVREVITVLIAIPFTCIIIEYNSGSV